jgi:hypothetical protein
MPSPDSERRSKWPAVVLAAMFLLPMLYVLSSGPASRLVSSGRISIVTYVSAYRPLYWAANSSETIEDMLICYWLLCDPSDNGPASYRT